jgi:hypothetical protein
VVDKAIAAPVTDLGWQRRDGQGPWSPLADCGAGDHGGRGRPPHPCPGMDGPVASYSAWVEKQRQHKGTAIVSSTMVAAATTTNGIKLVWVRDGAVD